MGLLCLGLCMHVSMSLASSMLGTCCTMYVLTLSPHRYTIVHALDLHRVMGGIVDGLQYRVIR